MLLSDFHYTLPPRLIAQTPAETRTGSRLMVVNRRTGTIRHDVFENLKSYLSAGDCLVFNDTRVMPARLIGYKLPGARPNRGGAHVYAKPEAADTPDHKKRNTDGSLVMIIPDAADSPDHSRRDANVFPAHKLSDTGLLSNAGASVEALLVREIESGDCDCAVWAAVMRPGKRLPKGTRVSFGDGHLNAEIIDVLPSGHRVLRFFYNKVKFWSVLQKYGRIPFPPYIKNRNADPERYQTVYSKTARSSAAPTAGLHFTDDYICAIQNAGVETAYITLHVGPGTFAPVKTENIGEHRMHGEYYIIGRNAAELVNRTKLASAFASDRTASQRTSKIICVGTTSLRALESVADSAGIIREHAGWTEIFIYPGYKFKCADALLTNFHLPGSTLLMLVCAFAGYELAMEAYRQAVAGEYRFYSFGDAMLIE